MSDYEPDADYLIEKCNAALFAPPRQCDVGTAEEQSDRFMESAMKTEARDQPAET